MDSELEEIRRLRLQDLQQSQGKAPGPRNEETEAQKEAAAEEMRRNMLYRLLDNDARERLNRIRLVKKDRVTAVENLIINHARMGLLRQQVDEPTLIKLLSSLPDKGSTVGKVTYQRVDKIGEQDPLDDLEQFLE